MTLLEMDGADDQGRLVGRLEGEAPRGTVFGSFDVVVAEVFGVFDVVVAEAFGLAVADRVAVRGEDDDEDDGVCDSDGTGEGAGAAAREGCAGMPIAGASACTPIRLLPMATARTAPTTETGQPKPRSRRPRRPDWSTKTGAGAGSSKLDSDIPGCSRSADPRSRDVMAERTLLGLSVQGT
ncbi:hypothetical protein [Streptomyces sp. NPDC051109]|uniref:hypothetical protein n=1 Tax=Streptomyces sp. NPDC051109 TaxID=3365642 RepID=UPI0010648CC7